MTLFPHPIVLRIVFAAVALVTTVAIASGQPSDSRLKRIGDAKTVKIAYRSDSKPFSFLTKQREPAGYTIDLCKVIVKSLEQQVNSSLRIEWIPVTTRDRFEAVANGSADMECGSSTVTLGRMKEVDFSNYIFVENTALVVTASSGIHAFADLRGRNIAVITGTTNEKALARALERRHLSATIIQVGNRLEGMTALERGRVDAFASDRFLLGAMKTSTAVTMLPEDISTEPYAIALPRGDWAFRLAVNTALAHTFRSGEILNIFIKWFGGVAQRPNLLIGAVYLLGSLAE
jgi:ABC-type amino acid transport substrate-binding protein